MPRILTTCPTSLTLVPTGHRTASVIIETMTGTRSFRCTSCQQVHTWEASQGVVEAGMARPLRYI
ncbi:hypothetical protein [Phenylobacterium sp.]|jgi:Zn-finger protein|uniref:hypothetical protein n=1 Tax=Phenylobacterium sp. TaxID=1871053 RepID=UPI002F955F27